MLFDMNGAVENFTTENSFLVSAHLFEYQRRIQKVFGKTALPLFMLVYRLPMSLEYKIWMCPFHANFHAVINFIHKRILGKDVDQREHNMETNIYNIKYEHSGH